ncbi:MAG: tetratricopeptide repeat protein, partial [Planctomycetota bacterium]
MNRPYILLALCVLVVAVRWIAARIGSSSGRKESDIYALDKLFNQGRYEKVIEKASGYIERFPESHLGWSQLGWAFLKLGRIREARNCLNSAIELEPEWDNAYVGLGVLCRMEGDLAGARANYNKAASLVPENPEAFSSLLVIELMDGNYAKAVEYGQKAWALRKNSPTIAAKLST